MSDRRIRIVCGHIVAFLGRLRRPKRIEYGSAEGLVGGYVEGEGEVAKFYLASFVLCDLVLRMLLAFFALAVGATGFGDVNLEDSMISNG